MIITALKKDHITQPNTCKVTAEILGRPDAFIYVELDNSLSDNAGTYPSDSDDEAAIFDAFTSGKYDVTGLGYVSPPSLNHCLTEQSQQIAKKAGLTLTRIFDGGMDSTVNLHLVGTDGEQWSAKGYYPAYKKCKLIESTFKRLGE